MLKLHLLDLFIIVAYLAICLLIGLTKTKKITTLKEFAIGYHDIPVTVLVCTIFASSVGAGTLLGGAEKVFLFGVAFVIRQLIRPLYWLISAKIFAARIENFKGCISISQIMYKLYGNPGRWVTNIAAITTSFARIAAQALAIGHVFNYFLGIDIVYGILVSYSILTIYSMLGGIRVVVITEIFKFIVFFCIIPISYIVTLTKIGGLQEFIYHLPTSHITLELNKDNLLSIVSLIFYILLPTTDSNVIQRYLLAGNTKKLNEALKTIAFISLPFSISICIIAYVVKAYSPNVPADEVFLYYIDHYLPMGLKGVMIAGVLAVAMSLAESRLNSTSVIIVNDAINPILTNISNSRQLLLLRAIILILSISSISIATSNNNILSLILLALNFWEPLILVPICVGFLGFKTNSKSFIASTIIALVSTVSVRIITGEFAIVSLSFGVIGSAIGLFGMHYWQVLQGKIKQKTIGKKFSIQDYLQGKIANIKTSVNAATVLIKSDKESNSMNIRQFCTFTLAYYVIYTLGLTPYYGHQVFSYLLIIGYSLCMILLFRDFIFSPAFQKKYLHLFWYFTLTLCLPMVSSYMLLISRDNDFWVINSIICCLSLIFFVDAKRFILLNSIGTAAGFILFRFTMHQLEPFPFHLTIGYAGYIYGFLIMSALFLLRPKEKMLEERVGNMQIFGSAMAHEVRSPLATIVMNANHLSTMLNNIAKTKQQDNNHYILRIEKEDFESMCEAGKALHHTSVTGIQTIDGLLTALKASIQDEDKTICSMQRIVKRALKEYTTVKFTDSIEIELVEDFKFYGSPHFVKHVLLNLIKNAHRHGGANVKIKIRIENTQVYVKDNGKGIPENILPHIFERFFTSNKAGTGIGLAFCKLVMENFGGDIQCKSEVGKYTMFTLSFPEINQ